MKLSHMLMMAVAPLGLMACSGEPPAPQTPAETEAPAEPEPEAEPAAWTGRGNEPGWTVTLDGATLTYIYAYGEGRYEAPQPAAEAVEGGRRYATADGVLSVTVLDKVCADDMSGMPYPQTVTVQMEDARVRGCGGDTNDLLKGAWTVTEVNGAPVVAGSELTVTFEAEAAPAPANPGHFVPTAGRISGKAGCYGYGCD